MSEAWDAWLAECLGGLNIDADVFGPYVTGIMVRLTWLARQRIGLLHGYRAGRLARLASAVGPLSLTAAAGVQEDETQQEAERASSVLDLLVDASPSGTVAAGTVERLTQRWQERCSGEAAAATAASNAVLAKFAADAAAQRAADEDAAAARRTRQAEEAENKRAVIAQLDAAASSDEEGADAAEAEEDDLGGGGGGNGAAVSAEVERARQEVQRAVAERRAAIKSAVEREDRKRAEAEARRIIREQAGHTNAKTPVKGRGAGDKGDAKRK